MILLTKEIDVDLEASIT